MSPDDDASPTTADLAWDQVTIHVHGVTAAKTTRRGGAIADVSWPPAPLSPSDSDPQGGRS